MNIDNNIVTDSNKSNGAMETELATIYRIFTMYQETFKSFTYYICYSISLKTNKSYEK